MRRTIVTHILQNDSKYTQYLREGYSSVPEHIATSRMKFIGHWATEIDIQAASDLIGVDIFTYSQDKWFKFSRSNASFNRHGCEDSGIYLIHLNNCHFEVVVCGKSKHGNCTLVCKSSILDPLFNVTSNMSLKSCEDCTKKLQYNNSLELKEEKRLRLRM